MADVENRHHSDEFFTERDTVIYPTRYFYTPYDKQVADALELYHPLGHAPPPRAEPSPEKTISTMNFPLFFFWHRIKTMSEESRYSILFGGLVGNLLVDGTLQNSVEANVIAQLAGLGSLAEARTKILDDLAVADEAKQRLFEDQIYGLGSSMGLIKWVSLAKLQTSGGKYLSSLKDIGEYFGVPLSEVAKVSRYIGQNLDAARGAVDNALNCPGDECDSLTIFKKQTASGLLSKTLLGSNSLMDGKNLLFKIEYSAFYEDNFQSIEQYADLHWTDAQTALYYDIDVAKLRPNATWNVLTHYSNLGFLRVACKAFWADNLSADEQKLPYLEQVQKTRDLPFADKKFSALETAITRFQFKSPQQAEVTCGYVEHVYANMVLESSKGSFELFLLCEQASEKMLGVLEDLRALAEKAVQTSFVAFSLQKNPSLSCASVMGVGDVLSEDQVKTICAKYAGQDQEDVPQFLSDLYDNCEHDSPATPFGLNQLTLQIFCTGDSDVDQSYQKLFAALYAELGSIYQFGAAQFSVSKLALLQLASATLTATENPYLDAETFPQAPSAHVWDPETFPRPFEMAFFVDKYSLDDVLLKDLSLALLPQVFNKSSAFNPLVLYYTVVFARQNNFEYLKTFMGLEEKHFDAFWKFLVLFVRDFYLQGFFLQVSEAELVQGIKSPFIRDIRDRPVLMGGDPSTPYPVFLRLQKADYLFEKFTGDKDLSKLDNFAAINGAASITNALPVFNGNVTSVYTTNPWTQEIPLSGCDNFCPEAPPKAGAGFELDSGEARRLSVYGAALNRTIDYKFEASEKVGFINCRKDRYRLDQAQYKAAFPEYHQTRVDGFFNMTSVFNFPILLSQNRLFNADPEIAAKYAYFDKQGQAVAPSENADGGFYETEQRTRGVTQMHLNLHFNLEIAESLLFVGAEDQLERLRPAPDHPFVVPLYNLEYWTNLPEIGWKAIFGKVGTANSFLDSYLKIFVPLFFVFVLLAAGLLLLYLCEVRRAQKDDEYERVSTEDESLSQEGSAGPNEEIGQGAGPKD